MKYLIPIFILLLLYSNTSLSQGAGNLLSFDGLNDYVNVDSVSNDAAGNSFTFEVWFKSDSGDTFTAIFAFNQSNGNNRILIYNQCIYDFIDAQNRYYNHIPSFNEWNYLVVSLDTFNQLLSVFINGVKDITISTPNNVVDTDLASIGQEWDNGLITSAHFKGLIDEVRLSDEVLSIEQIRERMHLRIITPNSNLIGYWRFDEGVGLVAGDSSEKGNDGILVNGPEWMKSSAPLGNGFASTKIVSSTGLLEFPNTNLEINYTSMSGNDTVVCTIINNYPEGVLPIDSIVNNKYWIINKFGDGEFSADLKFVFNDSVFSQIDTVKLYSRESRSDGDWDFITLASNITDSAAYFSNISSYGQFVICINKGVSGVETDLGIPLSFELFRNFPNPFNPSTKIKYSVPELSNVMIKVFDILGNEIETLVNEEKSIGTYEIIWYAEQLPSGVYFYQLKAGDFISTKKMVLMK